MTNEQKALVRASFAQLAPISDVLAELFYARLFNLDPGLRRLFHGDMPQQHIKLMQMLGIAVSGLDQPQSLLPQLQALGARHRQYGVTESAYASAADALLWTLDVGLGPAFTPPMQAAWAAVCTLLAESMQATVSHADAA